MSARGAMIQKKTLASICGDRWPRLLPPPLAAAYCGMLLPEFRRSPFGKLGRTINGREFYDRSQIDAIADGGECFDAK